MAINRLTASLATGVNENTLALANLNFDVSLLRVEAPAEYTSLGAALTSKRRIAAEEGTAHQTARRLGILFREVLPSTPHLLRAYGRRATEISRKSSNAEESSGKHGVFAGFLGADITSVWAAATSGASSIAVHLLACLLARLWSGPEATSIWVEIVAERKQLIKERAQEGTHDTSMELSIICSQEITRDSLAEWDASARAWLQIGDDAYVREQKQLMLILNNINLPVNVKGNTYTRVVDAWVTAMNAMEKLIEGQPQRAANGAPLMGLGSWHLYPDLLVLGEATSSVKFDDTTIPGSAQLTIGLENTSPDEHDGIYWSLSLSHLRFYGDPVIARTYTSRDASRLNIDELHMLTLGATLAGWGDAGRDPSKVAQFFIAIGEACVDFSRSPELSWLQGLYRASETLLHSTADERNSLLAIIALGRRKGQQFLGERKNYPPPLLGLSHPFISKLLSGAMTDPLEYQELYRMQFIASHLNLRPDQLMIRIRRLGWEGQGTGTRKRYEFFEYRTVTPHVTCQVGWEESSHIRWIEKDSSATEREFELDTGIKFAGCKCHSRLHKCHREICFCMQRNVTCLPLCHEFVDRRSEDLPCPGCQRRDTKTQTSFDRRIVAFQCDNMPTSGIVYRPENGLFTELPPEVALGLPDWNIGVSRPIRDFPTTPKLSICHNPAKGPLCHCLGSSAVFSLLAGDPDSISLFIRVDSGVRNSRLKMYHALDEAAAMPMIPLEAVIEHIKSRKIHATHLQDFLESHDRSGVIQLPSFGKSLHPHTIDVTPFVLSLNALALATDMYRDFPGATVALSSIERPLHNAHWVPQNPFFWLKSGRTLERRERFACIAFFESGSYDLRPSDLTEVIALSLRNSIYVSSTLLGDPYELSHKDKVKLVVGNVGKAGIVMMVAPLVPRVKPVDVNEWKQILHAPFQGKPEDCFRATSAHLAFTDFEMPFAVGQRGAIDKDIAIVETIVSIHDRGRWIGDIDVLSLYEAVLTRNHLLRRFRGFGGPDSHKFKCSHSEDFDPPQRLTTLDNWEEILDLPEDLGKEHFGIVRAQDNWLARLATACIAIQMNVRIVILPNQPVCWTCCCQRQWDPKTDQKEEPAKAIYSPPGDQIDGDSATSRQAVENLGLRDPEISFDAQDESGYGSDASVRTIEDIEPTGDKDGRSPRQIFIY